MNANLVKKADLKLHLHRRAFHHVNKTRPGMTVVCEKGLVWLTESNDLEDYMLRPGLSMVVGKRADVLMEALSDDAEVSIVYPN
ncbi:MAG: DUF2917 domain-containing protein [Chloroflexota bacterium]